MIHPLIAELSAMLPPEGVITDASRLAPRLLDARRRLQGDALALALPADAHEAALIIDACRRHGVAVVPQSGNTGLVGGATPLRPNSLLLGTDRLNRIVQVDAVGYTMTVGAGCILDDVRRSAAAAGRLFPLWLASSGSARLGGLIATNAGGLQVQRYGNTRELVLGLEAVLPDGRIFRGLHGLRKRNIGYDLKQLLIGSEGTLGFVTAASLRLFPAERGKALALVALDSAEQAINVFCAIKEQLGEVLTAFELMDAVSLQLVARHFPEVQQPFAKPAAYSVLIELSGGQQDVELAERLAAALLTAGEDDAVLAQEQRQMDALWALRERIPAAQQRQGPSIKHDLALPISAIPKFLHAAATLLQRDFPQVAPVVFGHVGDGNLHYNLGVASTDVMEAVEPAVTAALFALVMSMSGDISAEHGIGRIRRAAADSQHDAVERGLMRQIKQLFDPDGLFNPGVLV